MFVVLLVRNWNCLTNSNSEKKKPEASLFVFNINASNSH